MSLATSTVTTTTTSGPRTARLSPAPRRTYTTVARQRHRMPAAPAPARLAEPDGLAQWRAEVADEPRVTPPTPTQVRAVLAGVRSGDGLSAVARRARISQARVLDVVVGVGSRISQANKKGPKADGCLPVAGVADLDVAGGACVSADGGRGKGLHLLVVLGEGWERTAAHGRDVGRAYAAIALADTEADDRPVTRWLSTLAGEQPLHYAHFAHLRSVATGKMPTFSGLTDDRDVREAYLRAFDEVADAVAAASRAVTQLCRGGLRPEQVLAALRVSYWMVPDARILAGLAKETMSGDAVAGSRLRVGLGNLSAAVARKPAVFFPRTIADLSARQYRAILGERGFHPADMADAARTETDFTELSAALTAIREKVNSGADLDDAAEEVTRLAATWKGLDA